MATIVTRAGKGSPLTNTEVDSNFTNLNNDKQEILTEGAFVDGDKTKLDGIEALADVTDTVNVTAAGALMDSELTNITAVKALDQGVATTDEPSWDGVNLNAISTSIADTAVDVFVYDTRKDSDGGAWRKRCQHTSWYNETLNTSTRGSRKEFPAVAVIVAESNQVTIYDGDDPDMPMWMVFNRGGSGSSTNAIGNSSANNGTCCTALNGIIFYGGNNANYQNGQEINLIKEVIHRHSIETTSGIYQGNISERNSVKGWGGTQLPLVDYRVNDVAMTVLPNAPIDDATGLPIPTIAVATNGGVSVIKDDGSVVNWTCGNNGVYSYIRRVDIIDSNRLMLVYSYLSLTDDRHAVVINNFTTGGTYTAHTDGWNGFSGSYPELIPTYPNGGGRMTTYGVKNATAKGMMFGGNEICVSQAFLNNENLYASLVNKITSSYNTGWMNGNIKLATLSDTDDTNVTGSELVTNGAFATDSDWSYTGTGTGWSISGGTLNYDGTGGQYHKAYQNITVENGKTYVLEVELTALSGGNVSFAFASTNVGAILKAKTISSIGKHSITYTATSNGISVYMQINTATQTFSFDNVTLRLAEEDRSVNGNGLQVFGTITKNPVATGADLVAYSGFSSSNYLLQPYNSDLDFGTGDFCWMGWIKTSSGSWRTIAARQSMSNTTGFGDGQTMLMQASGVHKLTFRYATTSTPSSNEGIQGTSNIDDGTWKFCGVVRRSGTMEIWVNGVLENSSSSYASSVNFTNTTGKLLVGAAYYNGGIQPDYAVDNISLFRISATAPSAEQIKKIYEDEKVLFQENAKAVLAGTSDAVTALAYDDDTNILSVGTSAGRSDFSGLRRVNNTTTAVTTAISASNELIVEQ